MRQLLWRNLKSILHHVDDNIISEKRQFFGPRPIYTVQLIYFIRGNPQVATVKCLVSLAGTV